MSDENLSAENDGILARLRRAWHRCSYCGEDQRSEACCGIRYYPDRMDIPPEETA